MTSANSAALRENKSESKNALRERKETSINQNQIAMKKNSVWEVILRIFIAAATAALTALGTTSCMGLGPITM